VKAIDHLFRQHDVAPDGVVVALYRQLTQEWAQLHSLTSTRTQVRRWGRNEPALAGFTRPGDVVDAIDAGDHDRKNELLLALIRLFQGGQQLAGRTVLQALLPRLSRIGTRPGLSTSSSDTWLDDRRHIVLAEFWDVMSDYPVDRRPTRVAANLTLDTLHRVSGARRRPDDIPIDPADFATNPALDSALNASLALDRGVDTQALDMVDEDLHPDADLRQVITWGIHRNVITVDEAQLLTISYLPGMGPSTQPTVTNSGCGFAAAAAELGCTQAAVRQRCSRAARKLAAAVHAEAH
jgi:hypothetical protein